MTRSGLLLVSAAAVVMGCGFETRSDTYRCEPPGDECGDGRVCVDGWCVIDHDGGQLVDANPLLPDANPLLPDARTDDGGCDGPDLGFTPSNFDVCDVPAPGDAIDLASGDWLIDTDNGTLTELPSGTPADLAANPHVQSGGPEMLIVSVAELSIGAGTTLSVTGSRPLALVTAGGMTIGGRITASADATTPGPGGGDATLCSAGQGGDGVSQDASNDTAGSGGGGGGYGEAGGAGAIVENSSGDPTAGGASNGNTTIVPLRGGCNGGAGGNSGSSGGGGGGGLQLVAGGDITVVFGGAVGAEGAGGPGASADRQGGAGGGSGGALLLEAHHITIAGFVTAHGGGAAAGTRTESSSAAGEDGHVADATPAAGGTGGAGGNGGDGGVGGTTAQDGNIGNTSNGRAAGGGGGGGAVGRIHLRAIDADETVTGTVSPAAL